MIRTTFAATSGPIPSPGINVTVFGIRFLIFDFNLRYGTNIISAAITTDNRSGYSPRRVCSRYHQREIFESDHDAMNTKTRDLIIVGGGIIGLMTARALAKRGLAVTIVERGELGREASYAAGGILAP